MPAIQSLGIGSGLDANAIISQLMALEQQPLSRLKQAETSVQTQISTFGTVRAKIDNLATKADALASAANWQQTKVNLNGADGLSITAAGTADPVELDIAITSLAQRQSVSSTAFPSASSTVGEGTLTIQLGSWSSGFGNFTAKTGASAVDVEIGAGATSLSGIRDAINAADAGVTATILNDTSGARLVIRSDETGEENGFTISSDDTALASLVFDEASVLSRAALPIEDDRGLIANVRGSNLQGTINGAAISSASNTLTNVLNGITLTATKAPASALAAIERDVEGTKTRINDWVAAYNDLSSYLRQQSAYNETTKKAAPLQGDRVATSLQSQLRGAAIGSSSASSVFSRLSDVGISLQRDGSLKIDSGKLGTALENLSDVAALFSRDESDASFDGIARRMKDLTRTLTDADGAVSSRESSLRDRLKRNQVEQDKMNDRLARVEARLKAQYSALDDKMATLTGLSGYVSQQMQMLNNSGNRN